MAKKKALKALGPDEFVERLREISDGSKNGDTQPSPQHRPEDRKNVAPHPGHLPERQRAG